MRIVAVQHVAYKVAEHRITHKFETFVIRFGVALVGQSLLQEVLVVELITNTALQRFQESVVSVDDVMDYSWDPCSSQRLRSNEGQCHPGSLCAQMAIALPTTLL